jgi:hypothetical protein
MLIYPFPERKTPRWGRVFDAYSPEQIRQDGRADATNNIGLQLKAATPPRLTNRVFQRPQSVRLRRNRTSCPQKPGCRHPISTASRGVSMPEQSRTEIIREDGKKCGVDCRHDSGAVRQSVRKFAARQNLVTGNRGRVGGNSS